MSDDDDLWSIFGKDEDSSAKTPSSLPSGVRAAEHAFFTDGTLWPLRGGKLDLQAAEAVILADIKAHVSVSALQALELDGEQGAAAATSLTKVRDCSRVGDAEEAALSFIAAAEQQSSDGGGGWGCPAWGVGFLFCCAAAACARLDKRASEESNDSAKLIEDAKAALRLLDRAIIKSNRMDEGSSRWEFQYLKTVVGSLVEEAQARIQASERQRAGQEVEAPPSATLIPDSLPPYGVPQHLPLAQHVESRSCAQLSLLDFLNEYLSAKRPVVIKNYLTSSSWPGMERWHDLQFWRQQHGHRLVPVESARGALREMRMDDFIMDYLLPSNASHDLESHAYERVPRHAKDAQQDSSQGAIGYISQHGLFHQLRETQEEFSVPIYARGAGKLAMVNAWMGTRGTVTHLHTDEHDNLLAQVAGFKYLRLCVPSNKELLYAVPHPRATPGNPLNWFSPVDAEAPDLERHPRAAEVPWLDVTLGPGDLLFIPKGYWHYVRALSTSISVNFWF